MVVKGVRLDEIDDVKPVKFASPCISKPEIIPLGVSTRVVIWFQDQVIFVIVDLDCSAQVAAFES